MADWISVYLNAIGAPNTAQNRRLLTSWQRWEGGHTNNSARFNYLNTTQKMAGSRSINSVGVQAYSTLSQGAQAFARTLRNGRYQDLLAGFRHGDPYQLGVAHGLSTWLSGSPTSPSGAKYASKVLGSKVDVSAPTATQTPSPVQSTAPDLASVALGNLDQIATQHGHFDPMQGLSALTNAVAAARLAGGAVTTTNGLQIDHVQGRVNKNVSGVIQLAESFLGDPYVWGGSNPKTGFDCSGLLQYVWGQKGVKIPRVSQDQWKAGRRVSLKALRPGDAVFFEMGQGGPGHVAMYIGGGRIIESPHTGARVRITRLAGRNPVGARRFV